MDSRHAWPGAFNTVPLASKPERTASSASCIDTHTIEGDPHREFSHRVCRAARHRRCSVHRNRSITARAHGRLPLSHRCSWREHTLHRSSSLSPANHRLRLCSCAEDEALHAGAAMLNTIFPRLCGALPSISCAVRACANGRTVPTRAVNVPRLNKSVIVSGRAVVTATRKQTARAGRSMPLRQRLRHDRHQHTARLDDLERPFPRVSANRVDDHVHRWDCFFEARGLVVDGFHHRE
jgi:hypothetical protein